MVCSGMRRVAAHNVRIGDEILHQCVVELVNGIVVSYYTFTEELPMTEWLGDTIDIKQEQGEGPVAYWKRQRLY